jgi:hypothetical protein
MLMDVSPGEYQDLLKKDKYRYDPGPSNSAIIGKMYEFFNFDMIYPHLAVISTLYRIFP